MLLLVLLVGGGAALYYFKFRKPKQNVKGRDDLDEYEFGDEDFEDEEPVKKDDKRYIYGMLNCIACRNGRLWLSLIHI